MKNMFFLFVFFDAESKFEFFWLLLVLGWLAYVRLHFHTCYDQNETDFRFGFNVENDTN